CSSTTSCPSARLLRSRRGEARVKVTGTSPIPPFFRFQIHRAAAPHLPYPSSPLGVWTGDMGNTCTETWVTLFREAVSRKEGKRHALAGAGSNVSETGIRDAGLG